jgi:MFS family permease
MIRVSESYLVAFAVELGFRNTEIALLVTGPILLGTTGQRAASPPARWLDGRKRLVIAGVVHQSLCQVALFYVAWTRHTGFWLFLAAKSTFWLSGSAITPAWNAWMADLTAAVDRERDFARRSAMVHVALLVAFVGASLCLYLAERDGYNLQAYAG